MTDNEDRQRWEAQIKEISERYIQDLRRTANENMDVARKAYFELIKVLLNLSVAALPVLATVLGLGDKYVPQPIIPILVIDILLFLCSIVLGVCAKGFAALYFRNSALKFGNELATFLLITNLDDVYKYFVDKREENIKAGMFEKLNLKWFGWQLATFLLALVLLFWIFFEVLQ